MLGDRSNIVPDQATQSGTPLQPLRAKATTFAAVRTEHDELRAAMRVLGAVVGELAERIEILETLASMRDASDAVRDKN